MKQSAMFDVVQIALNNGTVALVDPIDGDLGKTKWSATGKPGWKYATHTLRLRIDGKIVFKSQSMHRVIISRVLERPLSPDEIVDHIDGNILNNSRSNLRLADNSKNCANRRKGITNTSGYKGVTWNKNCGKWQASIGVRGQKLYLGLFDTPQEAHEAYTNAALEHFGEFARLG